MSTRYGKPRVKIILGAATAVAAAGGMVIAVGPGTAAAQQLSRTFGYTCTSPVTGDQSFTAEVTANFPDKIVVGQPSRTIAVNAVAKVNASFTQWLANSGMSTIEGTADASAHVAAPQKRLDIAVPFRMAKTTAPASGPFQVKATASVTTPTFSHPGKATITAGGLTLHLLAKNAAGTAWIQADAPCTLNAGYSNVVASFDITTASSAPSATPEPTTGSTGSTTPRRTTGSAVPAAPSRTTESVAAVVPKPATSKGAGPRTERAITPGNPSPKPSSTSAEANSARATPRSAKSRIAGQGTKNLILLGVGVLLACAAAFYLGTRLKNHRRTSGDGGDQKSLDSKQGLVTAGVRGGGLDVDHHMRVNAATPQRRGHAGRTTSRGSMGRSVTEGRNLMLGRHVLNQADHEAAGARAGGGADPNSQLPGLLRSEEDVNAVGP